jgi:hypothetical protein
VKTAPRLTALLLCAVSIGGDALANLQLRRSRDVVSAQRQIPTFEVSGLASKRGTM